MNKINKDRAAVPVPPPLFFLACLVVGIFLECVFPSPTSSWPWLPRIFVSLTLFTISGLLAIDSFRVLKTHRTPFDPARPTTKIVQEGPFRFSRNPLYLALLLLLSSITVLAYSIWLLLAVPILLVILHAFAVRPEEEYLEQKFGDEYRSYKASVRRWI